MCDPDVLWFRSQVSQTLEILAYYSSADVTVESWSKCLEDDAEGFTQRNYTLTAAGINF